MSAGKTLRTLLKELRLSSSRGCIKENLSSKYILAQFKKYQTTDQTLCKAKEEIHFLGRTYAVYLESLRKHAEIYKDYHGKGERSVKETADLVGFKLPTDPK